MNNSINPTTCKTFLNELLYSWGSDTPTEAIWALQKFTEMLNTKFGFELEAPSEDEYFDDTFDKKVEAIAKAFDELECNQ